MFRRQVFRGEPHAQIGIGVMLHQVRVRREMIATHGDHAHGFRTARNDHLGEACQDAFGGESNRLKSGGAEAIDGHRRDRHWQPSTQRRDAGHIIALFGLGHCATQDNVLHFVPVEAPAHAARLP